MGIVNILTAQQNIRSMPQNLIQVNKHQDGHLSKTVKYQKWKILQNIYALIKYYGGYWQKYAKIRGIITRVVVDTINMFKIYGKKSILMKI